jgi:hypothetical protein
VLNPSFSTTNFQSATNSSDLTANPESTFACFKLERSKSGKGKSLKKLRRKKNKSRASSRLGKRKKARSREKGERRRRRE